MALSGRYKKLHLVVTLILLAAFAFGCAPKEAPPEQPAADQPAADQPAADQPAADDTAAMTSITILIPDNPVAFNGINTDTGYEQALGEMVMLSLADVDPNGNVIPELAVEIPTIENGGVVFDEDAWTMTATWKLRDDVYWADGEQVTADDVIFTWDALSKQMPGSLPWITPSILKRSMTSPSCILL